jgi:hypothetical protein
LPDPVARALSSLVDQLNKVGVRLEEIEERQNCLEDKLLPAEVPSNGVAAKND